jgi:hypothetical protein
VCLALSLQLHSEVVDMRTHRLVGAGDRTKGCEKRMSVEEYIATKPGS